MAYTNSKSGEWWSRPKVGNGPYAWCKITSYTMRVDSDINNPWKVEIYNVKGQIRLEGVKAGRSSTITVQSTCDYSGDTYRAFHGGQISWYVSGGKNPFSSNSATSDWSRDGGFVVNLAKAKGTTNLTPHSWTDLKYWFFYTYVGKAGGEIVSSSSDTHGVNIPTLVPRVPGVPGPVKEITSVSSPRYLYRNITIVGKWSGFEKGNTGDYTMKLYVINTDSVTDQHIVQSAGSPSSGTLTLKFSPNRTGNYCAYLCMYDSDGKKNQLASVPFVVTEPPPSRPTMGSVNNSTPVSINTTRSKSISANWGVSWVGWPHGTITYQWECYCTGYGLIKSGEGTSTSTSFTWNIPNQQTGGDIYWRVRAKTSANSLGWTGWVESGRNEIFWAYNEPSITTAGYVTPNRFQLYNGNTTINYTAAANINSWGDRPGERTMEYGLYKNGSILKWYGKSIQSGVGSFIQNLSYSVPETDLNTTYNVIAHKRLSGTEYLASNNPKAPATGTNHAVVGNITFYEVIGRVSGNMSINPNIIISGIPSEINYNWTYDKQSSEKVRFYIEVFRRTTGQITNTIELDVNSETNSSKSTTIQKVLVAPQQADVYEVRMKADVTELLGNVHTYTLAVLTPDVYNPPIGNISILEVSKPLPTDNATSLLAKQSTDITWDYTYSFQGVAITKVVMIVQSKPFGTEQFELEYDATTSPYFNNFTRVSTGDFDLGSQVKAQMRVYYQIIGYPKIYDIITDPLIINITPTRYLYFLASTSFGEKQLNKIHPLVGNKDKTSKKIFIQDIS